MSGERAASRVPYLRRPWTQGRIGGRTATGGLLILLGILLYYFLFGETGLLRQLQLQARKAALTERVSRLEEEERRLATERERLITDPDYRERLAREEWGYQRPGERVYHLRPLE